MIHTPYHECISQSYLLSGQSIFEIDTESVPKDPFGRWVRDKEKRKVSIAIERREQKRSVVCIVGDLGRKREGEKRRDLDQFTPAGTLQSRQTPAPTIATHGILLLLAASDLKIVMSNSLFSTNPWTHPLQQCHFSTSFLLICRSHFLIIS